MPSITLQTDFLCSHFFHACKKNASEIINSKMPDSLQLAVTAIVMAQCTLESYINYLISFSNADSHKVVFQYPKKSVTKTLSSLSVKDKWIYFASEVLDKPYIQNSEPFSNFSELVDHRNALVHFKEKHFRYTREIPDHIATSGELQSYMSSGVWLQGSVIDRICRFGAASPLICRDMILSIHERLATEAPPFINGSDILFKIEFHE